VIRRAAVMLLVLWATASTVFAQSGYAGRPLADVLRDLQRRGLNIVFSSELVKPSMRVESEPKATAPRQILDEVLAPHRLRVTRGANGALLVVRAARASSESASAPARTGTIAGKVVDKRSGIPLPGVTVTVQGTDFTTVTESDGRFTLRGVTAEPQPLFVSLVGYGLARPMVNVDPDAVTEVTIALADGLGSYSEELTVIGDRFRGDTPAVPAQQTLTSADLQDLRGVIADDPLRAVQALPSVATGDDFRSEFSVRGSDFRHIGLSLDGVPIGWFVHLTRGLQDTGSVSIVNGDVIERATLLSGPYPQRAAGRTGAWLSFDLQEGSRTNLQGHLSVSGTTSSVSVNGPLGAARKGSWLVSARQSYLQWILHRLDAANSTAFGFTDMAAKLSYDLSPRHRVGFSLLAGRSKLDEKNSSPGPNSIATANNRSAVAILSWQATFGRALVSQRLALASGSFANTGHFSQPRGDGDDSSAWYVADIKADLGHGVSLNTGGTVERARVAQTLRGFAFGNTAGSTVLVTTDPLSQTATAANGHAGLVWQGAGGRTIDAGAGLSHSTAINGSPVSLWVTGAWPIVSGVSLRAGSSVSRQLPDVFQIARYGGGGPMRAERGVSSDIGIEQRISPAVRWQVTVFNRDERDVYRLDDSEPRVAGNVIVPAADLQTWRNALAGHSRGVELMIQRRAPSSLSGWMSYSYGRARYSDAARNESFWADFDQRHAFNAYGLYRFTPKTSVSGKIRVGSNFPLTGYFSRANGTMRLGTERNTERLPAYSRVDLRWNHVFSYTKRRLTLFAEVLNVLGHTNYGPTDGFIRSNGVATGFTEKLMPFLPSVGFVWDF
jgi:hypothetical protein